MQCQRVASGLHIIEKLWAKSESSQIFVLKHILGAKAIPAINGLISRGLAYEDNDTLKLHNAVNLIRSFESAKHHLATYAEFYKPHHAGTGRNYVISMTSSLNDKGIKAHQEAFKKLHETLIKIYRDPELQGETPSFGVAFCDTFTDVNFDPEDNGERQ